LEHAEAEDTAGLLDQHVFGHVAAEHGHVVDIVDPRRALDALEHVPQVQHPFTVLRPAAPYPAGAQA
jgi:hypothetical protein